jgi:hypothetical protein
MIGMTNPEWIMAEAPVIKVRKERERKDHKRDRKRPTTRDSTRQRAQPRRY